MKKRFFIFLLLVTLVSINGFSQVAFGVKAGLNNTNTKTPINKYDYLNDRTGFFFGPTVKMALPLNFDVDGAILYDKRSTVVEYDVVGGYLGATTVKQQLIVIPINLRYNLKLIKPVELFLFAGPQLGFNVGYKSFETNYSDWDIKKAQFSVNMGAGVTILSHIQASVNYNLACSKSVDQIINRDSDLKIVGDSKFNAWQFSLGYFF